MGKERKLNLGGFFENITTKRAIWIIIVIGLIVYFNTLFNGFIGDDFDQIVNNPLVHSTGNIPQFFKGSSFYAGGSLLGIYYKPLLSTFYSLIYTIFGGVPLSFICFKFPCILQMQFLYLFFLNYFFQEKLPFFCP
jgi:hypothetical protein